MNGDIAGPAIDPVGLVGGLLDLNPALVNGN
jgi:hypothetical protein